MEEEYILKYRKERLLGEGGMSRVYLGVDPTTGQRVAIKVLHPHLAEQEKIRNLFLVEAQSLAKLDHPDIVILIDYNPEKLVLVQQYIDGMDLEEYITHHRGPIPEEEAKALFCKLLGAFAYVHSNKVIHRDIKPANILMTRGNRIKVVDFGIAKDTEAGRDTVTGTRMGTVAYMSPEQINSKPGEKIDSRTDIYSLGVLLHQMLTGKAPYDSAHESDFEISRKIVQEPLPRMKSIYEYVSPGMQAVVDKATAKDRAKRYQSCEEFMQAIKALKPAPSSAEFDWREKLRDIVRDKRVIAGVVVVLLVALGVFGFSLAPKKHMEAPVEAPVASSSPSVPAEIPAAPAPAAPEPAPAAPVPEAPPAPRDFAIGDEYGGGIIFYVDRTGQHGLIAAKHDINKTYTDEWDGKSYTGIYSWSTNQYMNANEEDYAYQSVGGTAEGIGKGLQNTMRILKKYPASFYPNSAAAVARAYHGGGHKDWFLPSKSELMQLYRNKNAVGGFSYYAYWSSTETSAGGAWSQYFYGGNQADGNKSVGWCFRAVRAF
jgi:eukaryotic-like serine/threonine-protein kinase